MSWYKLFSVFIMVLFLSGCSSKSWNWFFDDDEEEEQIVYEDEAMEDEEEAMEDEEVIYEYVYEDELEDEEGKPRRKSSAADKRRLQYENEMRDENKMESERRARHARRDTESRHGDEPGYAKDGMEPQHNIIHFNYKKSYPSREGLRLLEKHAAYLQSNPDLIITVEGHTDSVASKDYNKKLGLERAQVVADILEEMGVDAGQVVTVSYGEERPLREGDSEKAHAMNRRVELVY